jgi:pilus assembly protein Flp/PilA
VDSNKGAYSQIKPQGPLNDNWNWKCTGERIMKNIKNLLSNLANDESGQDLIEYALVAALVGLGAVASMKTLATAINGAFTSIGSTLTTNT